ncbi:hypothetical protein LINGRAHAP2_LOCUS32611 [Linum grandiflorum]
MSSSSSTIVDTNMQLSNLMRFLQTVTPTAPLKFAPLHQSSICDLNSQLQPLQNESRIHYFTLADMWKWYENCSVYGIGTMVSLGCGKETIQYFSPCLSSIQLYTKKPFSTFSSPRSNSGHDGGSVEVEKDSTDEDIDNNDDGIAHDNVSSGSSPMKDKFDPLYLSFFESRPPYERPTLSDTVDELAVTNPGLMTLTSMDLSPASWFAIAWTPIMHYPYHGEKLLETSFLTFHTLSSSSQGAENEINAHFDAVGRKVISDAGSVGIPLMPFGLATYKMCEDVWIVDGTDYQNLENLENAADSWLKKRHVFHHDFHYFKRKSTGSN